MAYFIRAEQADRPTPSPSPQSLPTPRLCPSFIHHNGLPAQSKDVSMRPLATSSALVGGADCDLSDALPETHRDNPAPGFSLCGEPVGARTLAAYACRRRDKTTLVNYCCTVCETRSCRTSN